MATVQFGEFRLMYNACKQAAFIDSQTTPQQFLRYLMPDAARFKDDRHSRNLFTQAASQTMFMEQGRPYVKIYPQMAVELARTKVNMPCSMLPWPYDVFEIRLPINEPYCVRERPDSPPLRSVMFHAELFLEVNSQDNVLVRRARSGDVDARNMPYVPGMTAWMDFGETEHNNGLDSPVYNFLKLVTPPQSLLSHEIDAAYHTVISQQGYMPGLAFTRAIFALGVSTSFFLSDQHEVIRPDIIRRLVSTYEQAKQANDTQKIKQVLTKSRKSGRTGFTAGEEDHAAYEREVVLPRPLRIDTVVNEAAGEKHGELTYGHIRGQHPHYYWQGPKHDPEKRQLKLHWLRPIRVRQDLPLAARGYRIVDP
jgi:hypothetical protein